jgi:GT2 family glycosyltransferase
MDVTVITVTYAKRWHLLKRTLEAALSAGAARAIVVDNGATDDIAQKAHSTFGDRVRVLRLAKNQGSASGYCAGIKAARESKEEFLLLLDDDNCVTPGAIQVLSEAYEELSAGCIQDNLCLVGFRPSHQPEIFQGRTPDSLGGVPGAFFAFHFRQIPLKIWRRLRSRRVAPDTTDRAALDANYPLRVAPFGGMFLHRSVFDRYGIPDPRFVVYLDDTEFSLRITQNGGTILLLPRARIEDLEQSWGLESDYITSFERWILLGSDRQVFYTARNRAFLEYRLAKSQLVYRINRSLVLGILWLIARAKSRQERFMLIKRAVSCGERGVLGIDSEYALTM